MLRLTLIVMVALATFAPVVEASAAPTSRELIVPYRTQLDGNPYDESDCGPATMGMVLAAFGVNVPTRNLRALVNDLQGTWGMYDSGTLIENLAVIAERNGLRPIGLVASGKELRRWTLDEIRQSIDLGRPVVPQVWYRGLPGREKRPYNGDHYIVVIGYDGDDFIYNDSIDKDGPGAGRRISAAQLDKAWRNSDFPYAALAVAGSPARPGARFVPAPPPPPAATATPPPRLPGSLRPLSGRAAMLPDAFATNDAI